MTELTDPFLLDTNPFDGPVLVTGARGCIGAWVMSILSRSGVPCVAFDLWDDRRLPAMVGGQALADGLVWETGDITDAVRLREVAERHRIRAIIHLAGLVVPFCRANPARGARVNVEGTVNVFELARALEIRRTAYASSVAVFGMPVNHRYVATLYGAYKWVNEQTAHVYWQDWQVPSIGIRPNVVYGIGREHGVSAMGQLAIRAAALGEAYDIPCRGKFSWLYAGEAASAFIAAVSREGEGSQVFNLNGACVEIEKVVELLNGIAPDAKITCSGDEFPMPADLDDTPIQAALPPYPKMPIDKGLLATYSALAP